MSFSHRSPSTTWENIPLPDLPGAAVWMWFKPAHAPQGLTIQIPAPLLSQFPQQFTLRRILLAAQISPQEVANWTMDGVSYPAHQGLNPLLDSPIPLRDADCVIQVLIEQGMPQSAVPAAAMPQVHSVGNAGANENHYIAIDNDWQAVLQLEKQIETMRKQLNAAQGRLQSLNRDLSTDERNAADSLDIKDWADARRFLRDSLSHLSRYVRECDMGITSGAGNRHRLGDLYEQTIKPRLPVPNLLAIQNDFEIHRKIAQSLVIKMQTVMTNSSNNSETKAKQILNRIAAKARKARSKR